MTKITTNLMGLLEATLTILVTTLEDCVWLVPLVAQASDAKIAFAHAFIFVATFIGLSITVCAVALALKEGLSQQLKSADIILEATGATLCWVLAGYFYYKAWSKKRARQRQREQEELRHADTEYGAVAAIVDQELQGLAKPEVTGGSFDPSEARSDTIQAWTIISLTIAGSLDEISYFPGLIVGKIFTPTELILGTLLVSLIILAMVDLLVRRCTRCLHVLDQIPLYAVIGLFAILLTLEVAWDLVT